ncbi:MAG: hypothetical protein A2W93_05565 [Bacteroidetes bacterium GWF2_43_63]|nr:MAG: hypothetical protein A2W94_07500 [Bacteroidetes bacterium GWE2_42_42]OFY55484.1 MAG: hypothetical protein A2W93_05565 [Bacteroidetes bacterium GWF2_43_63]HBG69960.1 hypothetical protein [Bacteroidales bacterium]HCB62614.1 hypothetical protein [Bacteroidales bacterium]HCY23734.1 hypothetical protein [Bacteroidales bacterium]
MKIKNLFLLFCLLLSSVFTKAQEYDKALADSLGADEYGMKMYTFVILKTGPTVITDSVRLNELFNGHMENINRLSAEGKLIVAGPFAKNDQKFRGLFIFNTTSEEEVLQMLQNDPTIREEIFEAEIFQWYGSAALPLYLDDHAKIEQSKH